VLKRASFAESSLARHRSFSMRMKEQEESEPGNERSSYLEALMTSKARPKRMMV